MPLTFNPGEIPTESEAIMLANLPPAGQFFYFFNTDHNKDIYSIDSVGSIVFVAHVDDDCCACALASKWLCGLNDALATGAMSPADYQNAIQQGFNVNSYNNGGGNCGITLGIQFNRLISIAINPRPTTLVVGANVQLSIVPTPTGANPNVLWVSSNNAHATVNSSGLVHGVGAGSVTITAYSLLDGTITDSITLTVGV